MDSRLVNQLSRRPRFLIEVDEVARYKVSSEEEGTERTRGQIILEVLETGADRIDVEVARLGLWLVGAMGTGAIGVGPASGKGSIIEREGGQLSLTLNFLAEVVYEQITRQRPYVVLAPDDFRIPPELFRGVLRTDLQMSKPGKGRGEFRIVSGRVRLTHRMQEGALGLLQRLAFPLRNLGMRLIPREGLKRSIPLRLVQIRDNANDPPTGVLWQDQLAEARGIWGKCCIELALMENEPPAIIERQDLRRSDDPQLVAESFNQAGRVLVFFVDNELANHGGARTFGGGTLVAKVVITEQSRQNLHLLAHELGHVFDGSHPGYDAGPFAWIGEDRTVLEDTGSASIENPDRNTRHNCRFAENQILLETDEPCRQQPDN
ncbi:MAG TPA: hypothetical protein VGG03_14685 [Thermoanaerobaculia bacterium]|jgi:hypothetical protein